MAAPVSALAATYTMYVTGQNGTLTGVSAIDSSGNTVAGSVYSGNTYQISESSPGPFTVVGTGTSAGGATVGAVDFGETVSQATYSSNVTLTLPSTPPTEVTAPQSISLTAGAAAQTVAVSVYNATYGAVSDGSLVVLTPSSGLTLTATGSNEAQVAQSVYASTVSGVVYAQLSAGSAGSYTLTVASPPGTQLSGGAIPVTVTSSGSGCGACGGGSTGGGGTSSGGGGVPVVGSTVTVDGVSGTVVLYATFSASSPETLTSSDGSVTLDIPAGAIASSGTVTLEIVEFGQNSTKQLLSSSTLASYEHSLGLSFDFSAMVNGNAVHTFAAPITALYSLSSVQANVTDNNKVDLMRLNTDHSLTYIGGKWTGSQVKVPMDGFTPYALMEVDRTFPDIQGHWAQSDIELMASKFVVQGYPDGDFVPEGPVTRAEFTAMLMRMLNIPVDSSATTTFTDVPSSAWYYGTVATAAEKGIVQGYSSTSFGPNDLITREQLVTIFIRAAEMENWVNANQASTGTSTMDATFSDASQVDSWAQADMGIAVANGLVKGRTPTTIVPLGTTTRAEAATWVARLFKQFM